MASTIHMEVTGLAELSAALKQLPRNIGQNVLRGAVRAGAKVVSDAVVEKAPIYTGDDSRIVPGVIKKSVYMKHIDDLSSEVQQVFFVGIRRGKKEKAKGRDAFWWSWVEFGHHVVPRAPKGGAKLSVRRAAVLTGSSIVPGSQYVLPHPFFRPAYAASKDKAVVAIREYLAKRIPEEVTKLGPR
jgi:HK97 gp10 family phage protein